MKRNILQLSAIQMSLMKLKKHIDMQSGKQIDGLVCTTDIIAIGAIIGLNELEISIPEQVRITGYDDSMLAVLYDPSLTSIHQPIRHMSQTAVKLLLNIIDNNPDNTKYVKVPVRLVERKSSH